MTIVGLRYANSQGVHVPSFLLLKLPRAKSNPVAARHPYSPHCDREHGCFQIYCESLSSDTLYVEQVTDGSQPLPSGLDGHAQTPDTVIARQAAGGLDSRDVPSQTENYVRDTFAADKAGEDQWKS